MVKDRQVLRLKCLCRIFGISSGAIAAGTPLKMHRNYVSNVWNLVYSAIPTKKEAMIEFLIAEGVPEELAKTAFETVYEFEEIENLRALLGKNGEIKSDRADIEFLKMGVMMIRLRIRQHFGLRYDPFQQRRDDEPFASCAFSYCREAIDDAIAGRGFLGIAGPTGTGKSVLWTYINQRLSQDDSSRTVTIRRFDKNMIKVGDIYRSILVDLAGEPSMRGNEERHRRVEELLVENAREGINTIVLVNEAHDLTTSGMVMLKRLWEAFNDTPDLGYMRACTVIMLGQEMLEAALRSSRPELREVVQRVDLELYGSLNRDEVAPYLQHRFRRDDGAFEKVFDQSAVDYMVNLDLDRTPQMVNVIASNAMYAAFQVGSKAVTEEHIERLRG